LETTGADVTECVGLNVELSDLDIRYESACDPRLNPAQTRAVVEYMFQILGETREDLKSLPSLSFTTRLPAIDTSRCGSSLTSADENTDMLALPRPCAL
jgi:hypothetical protein